MSEYVCGYVIHFSDDGPDEGQELHRGSLQECGELADIIPAVCYSGSRPLRDAEFVIVPLQAELEGGGE